MRLATTPELVYIGMLIRLMVIKISSYMFILFLAWFLKELHFFCWGWGNLFLFSGPGGFTCVLCNVFWSFDRTHFPGIRSILEFGSLICMVFALIAEFLSFTCLVFCGILDFGSFNYIVFANISEFRCWVRVRIYAYL